MTILNSLAPVFYRRICVNNLFFLIILYSPYFIVILINLIFMFYCYLIINRRPLLSKPVVTCNKLSFFVILAILKANTTRLFADNVTL